ncbi:MAG: type II toxin-antitoxin system HicB family antitoxin [bacterium]|nr:type II toxin-antitoxin system HicB family antitoxin [bacterium]
MKFPVTIDRDEDGVWIVECPSIPGCVSQGQTKEEALDNIREAIALCLEVRAEQGLPLTVEMRQVAPPSRGDDAARRPALPRL